MSQLENGKVVKINEESVVSAVNPAMTKPASLNPLKTLKIVEVAPKIALNNVKIIKKDGTKEDYNIDKVISAVKKSAARMLVEFTDKEIEQLCNYVNWSVLEIHKSEIEIFKMHCIVENALENVNPKVAKSYRNYRDYKIDFVTMLDKVYQESQKIMYIGDKENSNADSTLVSTKRSLIFNQLNKELYKKFFLTVPE